MRQGFTIPGGLADVRFRVNLTPVVGTPILQENLGMFFYLEVP
ncbi:hypothetical protein [Nostoc edaphicum]|nr:hypothetical protein [Nostoc edaphicum]